MKLTLSQLEQYLGKAAWILFDLIRKDGSATIPQFALELKVTTRIIDRKLSDFPKKELLQRVVPKKNGFWQVIEKGASNE